MYPNGTCKKNVLLPLPLRIQTFTYFLYLLLASVVAAVHSCSSWVCVLLSRCLLHRDRLLKRDVHMEVADRCVSAAT